MATLERIRSKGGVLVAVMIGFALLAFILTDLLSSGTSIFQRSQMEIAEIDGESVSIQEFQARVSEMEEYTRLNSGESSLGEEMVNRLREQAWNQMVNEIILGEKYEELGIEVTSAELVEMVTGSEVHPMIRQLFSNPQTGAFDKQQVVNFLRSKQYDPTANFYWTFVEDQLINERLFSKYSSLFGKGFYVTNQWIENEANARSNKVDFNFLVKRITSIDDDEVSVSESEIKAYYNENIDEFRQEASRDIEYLTFDVEPTKEDRENTRERLLEMKDDFSSPDIDVAQFVRINSDVPFNPRYMKPEALDPEIRDFVTTASEGDVYGPYFEDETFKLTRLVDVAQVPDSVRARHILLRNNPQNPDEADQLADSLINLLNNGADFEELARQYSEDQGSAINGGDLGWFRQGQMVKPFNDACFFGEEGDIVKVESQFGIHIIHIMDKGIPSTKYQLATLGREVTYSSKTYQDVYSEATRFAALNNTQEKFNKAIEEQNLTKKYGRNLQKNDRNVGNLESPRQMVKWAFEAEKGDMSPIFEFGDQFVIAVLTNITEEGDMPLSEVRNRIERQLINEKKKEKLIEQLKEQKESGKSLEEIAEAVDGEIQSASDITFNSFQVTGAGVEPALVSLAVYSPVNQVSEPAAGNNGVYLVQVTNKEEVEVDKEQVKRQLVNSLNQRVSYQLLQTIRDNAEIVDNRSNFY
ncbi:SurA N-terminal domain-containing protein [Anaerophaga thermohalophila]|jgi:peptidyl-prolyl cis-trans isomerase D|uniref:SurA N-terminal domain-containing protein n=1 Tax=Anaerophaga thermohalophila TaxID=177400 RepID=UPI000361A7AE|nr:SurA N-terminal domain-containing protein [Anaerophaga thermohalophila]